MRKLSIILLFATTTAIAQIKKQGEIEGGEIDIVRNREITLPTHPRNFDKIATKSPDKEKREPLRYTFINRSLAITSPKFNPTVTELPRQKNQEPGYNSEIKFGGGNYGRIFAEANVNSRNDLATGLSIKALHNSTMTGEVDGKNSATSQQVLRLNGRFIGSNYRLTGLLGYQRDQFYFYGYGTRPEVPLRDSIRQVLNIVQAQVGIENTKPNPRVDYSLKTGVTALNTRIGAGEFEWESNFRAGFPITKNFVAKLSADAFVGQRTDSTTNQRNLFKVTPTFEYSSEKFRAVLGIYALHESDNLASIAKPTHAYPLVYLDYSSGNGVHFFAGYEGTIQRNNLTRFLGENPWLGTNVRLLNTEKASEIYGGSKGNLNNGFQYEAKVAFGQYRNFAVFNNSLRDTTRFEVFYDNILDRKTTSVLSVSAQIGYKFDTWYDTKVKININSFSTKALPTLWHLPTFTANWGQRFTFREKLIVTTDLNILSGIKVSGPIRNETRSLPTIVDLNFKSTYLLSERVSAFVSINNILGKSYQRFQNYPVQRLNFLVGVAVQF